MAKVRWAPEAVDELENMPLSWARKIYETVELISTMPYMGRAREELRGKRSFPSGYYYIIYDVLEDDDQIFVTALQDCRRGDRVI